MPRIRDVAVKTVELPLHTPFHTSLRSAYAVTDIRVILYTDDGLVGVGSASPTAKITGETQQSIETALREFILPAVINLDIADKDTTFQAISSAIVRNTAAKAAVDIAVYDLYAKYNQVSLSRCLNDRPLQCLPTDATVSLNTPAAMEEQALALFNCGYTMLKVKLGGRDGQDALRIQRIRRALGNDVILRVDANQGWTVPDAIGYAPQLAAEGVEFIEQPVYMRDISGLKEIKKHSPIPIAADESVFDLYDLMHVLDLQAADIVNLKLMKTGGIHPAVEMIRLIQEAGLKWMVGSMMEGPASVSAAAALSNAFVSDYVDLDAAYFLGNQMASGGPKYDNGRIWFSDGPGHGVTFE